MRWPWQKQKVDRTRCLGIELHNGQSFAVLRDNSGVIARYVPEHGEQGLDGLTAWVSELELEQIATTISLDHREYELHLVEAPNVPDEELNDALRFRLKDLVSQPIESKTIQAFRLPGDAYRGRMDMAFAAVIDRQIIQKLVDWSREHHLLLADITIPELSVLHLVSEMEPETSVGVLRIDQTEGVLYLFQDGGLYLTRALAVGTNDLGLEQSNEGELTLETDSRLEKLTLELQRSMDYYESQLGMGSVGQIWALMPDQAEIDDLLPELEQAVNTPVRTLSLESAFNRLQPAEPLTASLATALGGSLSYELAS